MWNEPATDKQKYAITKLCMWKHVKEELESRIMTRAEAREVIYELRELTLSPK